VHGGSRIINKTRSAVVQATALHFAQTEPLLPTACNSTLHFNSVYAQMSRGKTEKITAMPFQISPLLLENWRWIAATIYEPNFGFISFPDELTTGSSMCPIKIPMYGN